MGTIDKYNADKPLQSAIKCSDIAGNLYKYIGIKVSDGKCYGITDVPPGTGLTSKCENSAKRVLPNLNKMVEKTDSEIESKYNSLVNGVSIDRTSTRGLGYYQLLPILATQDYINSTAASRATRKALSQSLLDDINGNLNYTMMSMCIWVPLGVISGYYLYNR